ncbi:hypothetical protein AGABI2DRAFT_119115 [Agaricus bisporus var. bisporus H97]|uniref:hypothetical protein n=1 Tax=Agaricus bisporus var. bisporus (strain H97 / ATCC MYA-4626 / FGSC 10389) TaxID=936046 RepID=UPI00029F7C55|nr:hypothetical protein AGABI2DRAFT_119115 [Agaricus bisporus var. bisporus H97]EKV46939.1 hypothetical protein AGABI2DRAFT_119115 [Agaricus bisporus var. bisporus H97]
MSSTKDPVLGATHDDESARVDIAVKALGDMRSRAAAPATEARASSQSSRGPDQDDLQQSSSAGLVARMTSFPLVGTAIRAYEHGKASSRVVKYSAEMVESSVKTISKPVINRLPVNQLDEFACRQLDRLDRYRRPSIGPEPVSPRSPDFEQPSSRWRSPDVTAAGSSTTLLEQDSDRGRLRLRTKTLDGSIAPEGEKAYLEDEEMKERCSAGIDQSVPLWIKSTHSCSSSAAPSSPDSRIGSPLPLDERYAQQSSPSVSLRHRHSNAEVSQDPERQVAQRSRWQAMLLEAGGLGVALSDENMRRLKYCLNWLQFATAHIDAQILVLRDFIECFQPIPRDAHPRRPPISEEQLRKLTEVRKDIVSTIRQMVNVVSKYAGGALPEPARGRVRGFILKLPHRWASKTAASGVPTSAITAPSSAAAGNGERERETVAAAGSSTGTLRRGQGRERRAAQRERGNASRATSPTPSEVHLQQPISHSHASATAQRILNLATESLDMMRNVTGVVKDSLDCADAWVNRLRMVGVQRGSGGNREEESLNQDLGLPPVGSSFEGSRHTGSKSADYGSPFQIHRRTGSSSSVPGEDETLFSISSSAPESPFTTATTLSYLSNSSSQPTVPSSSMPSTPTNISFVSPSISSSSLSQNHPHSHRHHPHSYALPPLSTSISMNRDVCGSEGGVANAPSPGGISFSSMHITSRFNTPKMAAAGLPEEDNDSRNILDDKSGVLGKRRSSLQVHQQMDVDSS